LRESSCISEVKTDASSGLRADVAPTRIGRTVLGGASMSDVTPLRRMLHLMSQALRRGRRTAQRPRTFRAKPRVEALEDRTLPATVAWISSVSGAWDVGSNWSTGRKPGAADDVVTDPPALPLSHSTPPDPVP